MQQILKNYNTIVELETFEFTPKGDSASPKGLIFHAMKDNSDNINVLDIGFGTGSLGSYIKSNPDTNHWQVDGIDGWRANCFNNNLLNSKTYRNIWHGLAQELPSDEISKYEIICLLDVIEHLNADTAKWLLRTLFTNMGQDSLLFVSTPLWFYPQDHQQNGDLEEHLIGVPASSMLALIPTMYAINYPLIGGFIYKKSSLNYIDFFQPTHDKNFSYEMGANILKALNINAQQNIIYKTNM